MRSNLKDNRKMLFPVNRFFKRSVSQYAVNPETGEMIPVKSRVGVASRDFVCMFRNNGRCLELFKGIDLGFIYAIMCKSTYVNPENDFGGNILDLHGKRRKAFADFLGISVKQLDRHLNKCLERRIIIRVDYSTFQVNPVFFARGSMRDIVRLCSEPIFSDCGVDADNSEEKSLDVSDSEERAEFVFYSEKEITDDGGEPDVTC